MTDARARIRQLRPIRADVYREALAHLAETESDLFSPFRRGDEADAPGVGLGLFIARRIVDGLGGSIRAHSGHGSVTFTLRMPVEVPGRRAPNAASR